jgi:hypothetical protein
MAVFRAISKENPRQKKLPPSLKWKIAFFISLGLNITLILTYIIRGH